MRWGRRSGSWRLNQTNKTNMKNKARGHRTGNGSETLRMDDTGEEEDDMEVGWTQIEGR